MEQELFRKFNPLAYTSLTSSSCAEHLHLPIGKNCTDEEFISKLESNLTKLKPNVETYETFLDNELIPNDGSREAKVIRTAMKYLNVDSEYKLLLNKKIIEIMGEELIEKQKERFKPFGNKFYIGPACGLEVDKVLESWAKVFKFFKPLETEIYSDKEQVNTFTATDIVNHLSNDIKVVAGVSTYATMEESGWHALTVMVDTRTAPTTVEFFDSNGDPPPYRFTKLMYEIQQLLKDSVITISAGANIHQETDSECALHSMIYIRRRLEGVEPKWFRKSKILNIFAENFRYFIYSS